MARAIKMLPWFGRAALMLGFVACLAGLLIEHSLIYLNGKIRYPTQAIAISQRTCYALAPSLKHEWVFWRAEFERDLFPERNVWVAGYSSPGGFCYVTIDVQSAEIIEERIRSID